MLLVVTIRSEGEKTAYGHIAESNSARAFCGESIPGPVIDIGMENPGNPYVGKVPASCVDCVSEYNNGRRSGYAEK